MGCSFSSFLTTFSLLLLYCAIQNVDWEAHPAEIIISKTRTKYIVARRGLPLHEYGEVPIAAANRHIRAGQALPEGQICPITAEHLDDYDSFCKGFNRDVFDNRENSELVLDNLQDGTKLEACSFLGAMRAPGYELHATTKKEDIEMKVPMLVTSRVVQRLLERERSTVAALRAEIEALRAASNGGKGEKEEAEAEAEEMVTAEV